MTDSASIPVKGVNLLRAVKDDPFNLFLKINNLPTNQGAPVNSSAEARP